MTKQEAIKAMRDGKKVTHRYFSPGEWITFNKKGYIETEEGYTISQEEFWHYRLNAGWEDGYELFN